MCSQKPKVIDLWWTASYNLRDLPFLFQSQTNLNLFCLSLKCHLIPPLFRFAGITTCDKSLVPYIICRVWYVMHVFCNGQLSQMIDIWLKSLIKRQQLQGCKLQNTYILYWFRLGGGGCLPSMVVYHYNCANTANINHVGFVAMIPPSFSNQHCMNLQNGEVIAAINVRHHRFSDGPAMNFPGHPKLRTTSKTVFILLLDIIVWMCNELYFCYFMDQSHGAA